MGELPTQLPTQLPTNANQQRTERKRTHGEERGGGDEPFKKPRNATATTTTAKRNRGSNDWVPQGIPRKVPHKVPHGIPHRVPTNTQTDIQKIIRALSEYARGTSTSYGSEHGTTIPTRLEPIPRVLVGLIGSHCEADPGGVAEAARGVVGFCGGSSGRLPLRFFRNRGTILRNEFRSVLSSGGTEIVLSALQRITPRVFGGPGHGTVTHHTTAADASREAIYHCWGVIRAGVAEGGLSKTTLLNVVNECVFAMNHEIDLEDRTSNASNTSNATSNTATNATILSRILVVLSETLSRPELSNRDLFGNPHGGVRRPCAAVFTACLSQLARACSCGMDTTTTSAPIVAVIGDTLGVFVACAQRNLIAGSDYERLVPACRASLARYEMETAASGDANPATNPATTILVRIVELMEAEDKIVGLWLRHTYGIPPSRHQEPPQEIGSGSGNGDLGVPPPPGGIIDNGSPPRVAPLHSWPSVLVAEPDDDETSDEDEDDIDDEDDDGDGDDQL